MRKYEVMYIITPSLEDAKYEEIAAKFTALVTSNGGEVLKVEMMGKRRLAYEINKLRDGYYVLMEMMAPAELPLELERNFKIADEIMRYLVVRVDE